MFTLKKRTSINQAFMEIIVEICRSKNPNDLINVQIELCMYVHVYHYSGPPQPPGLTRRLVVENYKSKNIYNQKQKNKRQSWMKDQIYIPHKFIIQPLYTFLSKCQALLMNVLKWSFLHISFADLSCSISISWVVVLEF